MRILERREALYKPAQPLRAAEESAGDDLVSERVGERGGGDVDGGVGGGDEASIAGGAVERDRAALRALVGAATPPAGGAPLEEHALRLRISEREVLEAARRRVRDGWGGESVAGTRAPGPSPSAAARDNAWDLFE